MGGGGNKNAFMLTVTTAGTCAKYKDEVKESDLYGRLWDGGRIRVTKCIRSICIKKCWVFGYTNGAGVNALPANTNNPFRQCFAIWTFLILMRMMIFFMVVDGMIE